MSKNHSRKNSSKLDDLSKLESSNLLIEESQPISDSNLSEENFSDEIQKILKEENLILPSDSDKKSDKKNLRKYLSDLISEKKYSQKEILTKSSSEFPHLLKATISTILSDSKNARYNKFDFLVIIKDDIYQFSDEKNEKTKK